MNDAEEEKTVTWSIPKPHINMVEKYYCKVAELIDLMTL